MDPTLASTSTSGPSSSTPSKVSPPPRSSAPTSGTKRRIVASRACDVCKAGKRKCDGVQPCAHCLAGEKTCAYTIVDKRRKRNNDDGKRADSSSTPGAHPSPTVAEDEATLALLAKALVTDDLPPELRGARSLIALQGGGNEQEPKQLSFIEKLHRHLTVAFGLRSFPRGLSVDTELTSEVDFDFASFFLPGREEGAAMLTCYFEHAATSYRFVDRSTVEGFFKKFYDNPASLGKDETVLLLMLLAAGCLWSSSWTGVDPATVTPKAINLYLAAKRRLEKIPLFHPRLITVQTFMAMTQLLLGLSRFQSAWMALGQAARLGQLLGLHRASTDSSVIGTPTDEMRRRVFWFSLMMDRYLSLVLGFPALYDESDVTQTYPTVPDLGDVTDGVAVTNEARLLVGGMAHIKWVLIFLRENAGRADE
ncbi:hypothetical protein MNV49_004077 [Pseudohyphozyma bogoriensis]|nr:hypothetical protein MNV49_004077 [Pseudohyphozyma bogoriensis]